ncbi:MULTISPECIES: hypothetical protein [Sorangium]|uniref:Secreted protein n=1 Tax=Sorangium cellulosum TaxID=56 RepID=A0A4P2QYT7_SORCE|nr:MULTISPECIES: hypothetical protein [Sorangium]AUX34733.1 uncharacterized protein SOCE836_069090 [Sorangium cellulosum]WCQ94044.1 hypothetical protein NQZ70_06801 [Sorangium sp. Soce836]
MGHGLVEKSSALVLCGGLVMLLASACDLSYTCDTVEPGGAGAGYPTGSAGAGDYPHNDEGEEAGAEEIGSAELAMAGSCSPSKTCTDMFVNCQDKGWPCTRIIEGRKTLCAICRRDCQLEKSYSYRECYDCGFE